MLRAIVRVVVLNLVIVPRHEPRTGRVRGAEIGIALVKRVPDPIVVERVRLGSAVLAHVILAPRRFVDVVTEVHDQIEIVAEHVAVRVVVALLVLLAGGEGQAHTLVVAVCGGRRSCATGGTHLTARSKAIPVPPTRLEVLDLDVDRVRERGSRADDPPLDDPSHAIVSRHFPFDRDDLGWHPARRHERGRCQAGPEHDARRRGIARSDAERERRPRKPRLGRNAADERGGDERGAQRQRAGHELAAPDASGSGRADLRHRPCAA